MLRMWVLQWPMFCYGWKVHFLWWWSICIKCFRRWKNWYLSCIQACGEADLFRTIPFVEDNHSSTDFKSLHIIHPLISEWRLSFLPVWSLQQTSVQNVFVDQAPWLQVVEFSLSMHMGRSEERSWKRRLKVMLKFCGCEQMMQSHKVKESELGVLYRWVTHPVVQNLMWGRNEELSFKARL